MNQDYTCQKLLSVILQGSQAPHGELDSPAKWLTMIISSSSAMAETARRDFKGWVTLRLNFRLKGYVFAPTSMDR